MDFIKRRDEATAFVGVLIMIFTLASLGLVVDQPLFGVLFGGLSMGLFISSTTADYAERQEKADAAAYINQAAMELNRLYRIFLATGEYEGSVYVIQDVDVTGWCKIGFSADPMTRIGHFDTMLPFEIAVLHVIPCKDPQKAEIILHRRFADKRKRGEWFALNADDLVWIKSMEKA